MRIGNYKKLNIPTGTKYGLLTVISEAESVELPSGQRNRRLLCVCDCGNQKAIRVMHLTRGRIQSCGCMTGEFHGESHSPIYNVWRGMKNRCNTDTYIDNHRYKDRGITVCKEWSDSYICFRDWALLNGYMEGLQLDRKENDKGYYPDNCRFVTNVVNVNNRDVTIMVEYNNESISLCILLRDKNLLQNYGGIYGRIKRGWKAQKAIDTPIRKGNYKKRRITQATEKGSGRI